MRSARQINRSCCRLRDPSRSQRRTGPPGPGRPPVRCQKCLKRRAGCCALKLPRSCIKALERLQLFRMAELGVSHGRFQETDGFVIDLERNRIWVPVFAAMGEREARRVLEATGCTMHHLRDHGERLHGARADAGGKQ